MSHHDFWFQKSDKSEAFPKPTIRLVLVIMPGLISLAAFNNILSVLTSYARDLTMKVKSRLTVSIF